MQCWGFYWSIFPKTERTVDYNHPAAQGWFQKGLQQLEPLFYPVKCSYCLQWPAQLRQNQKPKNEHRGVLTPSSPTVTAGLHSLAKNIQISSRTIFLNAISVTLPLNFIWRWLQMRLKVCEGTEGNCPCSLFHFGVMWGQCNLNYPKKAVANRKGQPTAPEPQLWHTEGKKAQKKPVDRNHWKVLLKYPFQNQDVSLWNWAWSLSHLKLKHFIF